MVQDKRLLWHPRHDNRFVVGGGTTIALYEWAPDYPEIRHVTSQHDLQHMRCFAWSPSPTIPDLFAVGTSTGKVDLLRLTPAQPVQRHNALSSGPVVSLPARTSRPCHAVAFSAADPSYLAVGLDKYRGDCSIVIWDISTAMPTLSLTTEESNLEAGITSIPPIRPQPQIPRSDPHSRTADTRIVQQHAPTEIVSALSFLPDSTHHLIAGISARWLRLFDLRIPNSPNVSTSVAAKVQGITTDPFDPHRFATFGDSMVSVWDLRKLVQPVLAFTERDAGLDVAALGLGSARAKTQGGVPQSTPLAQIEFSCTRRGGLVTLERDANYVRFWDVVEGNVVMEGSEVGGSSSKDSRVNQARKSWASTLPWPAGNVQQSSHVSKERDSGSTDLHSSGYILADTRRTRLFPRPVSSFALAPLSSPHASSGAHPLFSNVMLLNKDGDLQMYSVNDAPKHGIWSTRGELAIAAGTGVKIIGSKDPAEIEEAESSNAAFAEQKQSVGPSKLGYGSRSASRSRSSVAPGGGSLSRGRAGAGSSSSPAPLPVAPAALSSPTLFGRGDEDGFPALGSATTANTALPTGLSATRPRTYSPAALRNLREQDRDRRTRSRSRAPAELPTAEVRDEDRSNSRGISVPRAPTMKRSKTKERRSAIAHVIEDDISLVMRRRALAGYCLSKPQHNIMVAQGDGEGDPSHGMLSELWAWIAHSQDLLCIPTSRVHGYDFAHHGLWGIWEGLTPVQLPVAEMQELTVEDLPAAIHRPLLLDLPQNYGTPDRMYSRRSHSPADELHGNWQAALSSVAMRRGVEKSSWKPTVPTSKLAQRQVALLLCGWSLREEDLMAAIQKWEKEGKIPRAACWLVFSRHYTKAMDILMRSEDESHRMMSGTIAALLPHGFATSKSLELREHCERLIVRLHDPYFRAMLTHLALGDWSDVLDEEVLPFHERLAIAFQFLDDKTLTSYLKRSADQARTKGDIDSLLVTGLTKRGFDILQAYVDRSGDVQTAAILSSYVCPQRFKDRRAEKWLNSYRDFLDGLKLYHVRVGFDIERGQVMSDAIQNGDMRVEDVVPRQVLIRCHYCNKPVTSAQVAISGQRGKPTACPNCSRALPRCSVCLMTLGIIQDSIRDVELGYSQFKDTIDDAIVICQTCRHGGHASHILEWFLGEDGARVHGVCPVADCNCRCADEF